MIQEERHQVHIEDVLREKGVYVSTTVGVSMYPMLRNRRDTIVIRPAQGRLHKYDVPLYKRGDDYVLHRIVKVTKNGYVICGDNCLRREYHVEDKDILGVLVEFSRDDRKVNMNGLGYRLYSRIWVVVYPVRCVFKIIKAGIKKIVQKGK